MAKVKTFYEDCDILVVGGGMRGQVTRIVEAAEAARLQAGSQADARWGAQRGVDCTLGKAHAASGLSVEVGRLQEIGAG